MYLELAIEFDFQFNAEFDVDPGCEFESDSEFDSEFGFEFGFALIWNWNLIWNCIANWVLGLFLGWGFNVTLTVRTRNGCERARFELESTPFEFASNQFGLIRVNPNWNVLNLSLGRLNLRVSQVTLSLS